MNNIHNQLLQSYRKSVTMDKVRVYNFKEFAKNSSVYRSSLRPIGCPQREVKVLSKTLDMCKIINVRYFQISNEMSDDTIKKCVVQYTTQ